MYVSPTFFSILGLDSARSDPHSSLSFPYYKWPFPLACCIHWLPCVLVLLYLNWVISTFKAVLCILYILDPILPCFIVYSSHVPYFQSSFDSDITFFKSQGLNIISKSWHIRSSIQPSLSLLALPSYLFSSLLRT